MTPREAVAAGAGAAIGMALGKAVADHAHRKQEELAEKAFKRAKEKAYRSKSHR